MNPPFPAELLPALKELLASLAQLRPLGTAGGDPGRDGLISSAMLLLEYKALPEASRGHALPLFLAVQGGTNVGKSTIFNALAGKILSPSMVLAAATKHPLVYLHERWRPLLDERPYPRLELRELADPKELITGAEERNVVYFRFHGDPRLEHVALVDSPDFDSTLASNAEGAELIAAISDVTLFVTTPEKYRDRTLVEALSRLVALKGQVYVVFNRVDEEIVFGTLVDDLKTALGTRGDALQALRIPGFRSKHPEDDVRLVLEGSMYERLGRLDPRAVKPAVLARTTAKALELSEAAIGRYSAEVAFQRELRKLVESAGDEARQAYAASFQLALPEETLAIRRALTVTELGQFLTLSPTVERSHRTLGAVGAAVRRLNDTVRRVIVRLSRSDQGTIDGELSAFSDYARARNQADAEQVLRTLDPLRVKLESFVRGREEISALAHGLARQHFTPQAALAFAAHVRARHVAAVEAARGTGEEVLRDVERWLDSNPRKARLYGLAAVAFKIAAGALLVACVPFAGGLFSILTWLTFASGYMLGAYAIALLVAFRLRRRHRFESSRKQAMAETLSRVVVEPLEAATDRLFSERDLKRVARAVKSARAVLKE